MFQHPSPHRAEEEKNSYATDRKHKFPYTLDVPTSFKLQTGVPATHKGRKKMNLPCLQSTDQP